jgi:uncharacterized protein (DUF952 family)
MASIGSPATSDDASAYGDNLQDLPASWHEAESEGVFRGSGIDHDDGYIHFSTGAQVTETAARHFAGMDDLMLIAVDDTRLGAALKWEPARTGDFFPHLYEPLPLVAVLWTAPLSRGEDGRHRFPVLDE